MLNIRIIFFQIRNFEGEIPMKMKDKIVSIFSNCEPQTIVRRFIQYIINVLVVYIILVLSIGLIRTLSGIKRFFLNMPIGQTFNTVVTDILTHPCNY